MPDLESHSQRNSDDDDCNGILNYDEDFAEFTLKIPRGAGLKVVGENLYENNMIKSPLAFYVYSRLVKPVVKAGVYKFHFN